MSKSLEDKYEFYNIIKNFYGDRKAKRSQVPLINHINEGIDILEKHRACKNTINAFILHPIFQSDEDWVLNKNIGDDIPHCIMRLVYEYRKCANAYLSKPYTDGWFHQDIDNAVQLNSVEVALMLYADKKQNKKDFMLYHMSSHARSMHLRKYFDNWIEYLESYLNKNI